MSIKKRNVSPGLPWLEVVDDFAATNYPDIARHNPATTICALVDIHDGYVRRFNQATDPQEKEKWSKVIREMRVMLASIQLDYCSLARALSSNPPGSEVPFAVRPGFSRLCQEIIEQFEPIIKSIPSDA